MRTVLAVIEGTPDVFLLLAALLGAAAAVVAFMERNVVLGLIGLSLAAGFFGQALV